MYILLVVEASFHNGGADRPSQETAEVVLDGGKLEGTTQVASRARDAATRQSSSGRPSRATRRRPGLPEGTRRPNAAARPQTNRAGPGADRGLRALRLGRPATQRTAPPARVPPHSGQGTPTASRRPAHHGARPADRIPERTAAAGTNRRQDRPAASAGAVARAVERPPPEPRATDHASDARPGSGRPGRAIVEQRQPREQARHQEDRGGRRPAHRFGQLGLHAGRRRPAAAGGRTVT